MVDSDVGASFTGTTTRTYMFHSWVDKNPVGGVPGLVGYCVYTNQTAGTVTATATGDNGQPWKASKASQSFSYTRPGGEKSNIGLDGDDHEMGTATFSTAPSSQTILLHVSDTAKCRALYGGDATTCFVLPGPRPGPICDAGSGNTDAAYNAIPTDVEHCSPPSLGFEATSTNEFGDEVTLNTAGGDKLVSMTVDFQSYGCETSGHWNTADCVSPASPGTFTVPGGITAKIYDSALNVIATSNVLNPDIPFRPSAIPDAGNCPNPPPAGYPADSRFKDSVSGQCNFSLSVPLTFTFPAGTTFTNGQDVVWTVQFNTTHAGYAPIISNLPPQPCAATAQGCGYDSLNVGAMSYPNAPYAGTDPSEDTVFWSHGNANYGGPFVPLGPDTGWTGFRPLGQIVLGP